MGMGHSNPPKNKKSPLQKFLILKNFCKQKPVIGVGELHCTNSTKIYIHFFCKISLTAEKIGLYPFGNIPTGPLVVLSYFLGGWNTTSPQKYKKIKYYWCCCKKIFFFLEGEFSFFGGGGGVSPPSRK